MRAMNFRLDTGDLTTGAVLVDDQLPTPVTTSGLTKKRRKGTNKRRPACPDSSHPAHHQLVKGSSEITGGLILGHDNNIIQLLFIIEQCMKTSIV